MIRQAGRFESRLQHARHRQIDAFAAGRRIGLPVTAEARLRELGIELPALRRPAGNYVGWVRTGDLLFLSGQGADGFTGRVGADLGVADGRAAARACALNLLAQARDAVGSLDRVARVVKLLGFVACTDEFTAAPAVIDGASDLLAEVFGDGGRHARSAIGVRALPLGFAVEVEMILELRATGAR
jgi:enamine deaminase RidA (YjgF/YER057c/UK114 family)